MFLKLIQTMADFVFCCNAYGIEFDVEFKFNKLIKTNPNRSLRIICKNAQKEVDRY